MTDAPDLFHFGWFPSHSGVQLPWKFDCDALSDGSIEAIARLIAGKVVFSAVYGIPRGGLRLARALEPHCTPKYPLLIVDGVVILARGECPDWVWPILSVNEWAQSRGTGLGD